MFDAALRPLLEPVLARLAATVDRTWISPDRLTLAGLVLGLASAVSAATALWWWALALWLTSRLLDGLDGSLARRRRADGRIGTDSEAGGFLDITADFTVYGATVVGVAIGVTSTEQQPWLPFLLVLLAYYVNGAAFLAFSSIAERTGRPMDDGRSLSFLGGLAEGAETVFVHSLWLLFPAHAGVIAAIWSALVGVSAVQRLVTGTRALR